MEMVILYVFLGANTGGENVLYRLNPVSRQDL